MRDHRTRGMSRPKKIIHSQDLEQLVSSTKKHRRKCKNFKIKIRGRQASNFCTLHLDTMIQNYNSRIGLANFFFVTR